MIRRPPRSTLDRSSAASDVYKRQDEERQGFRVTDPAAAQLLHAEEAGPGDQESQRAIALRIEAVSYTHLRAHETVLDLVCRLLLEKKKYTKVNSEEHYQLVNQNNVFQGGEITRHNYHQSHM